MVQPLILWPWRNRAMAGNRTILTPETATDSELLTEGRAGNQEALSLLFTRHQTALFRLCLGFTGQVADAEDLVQDVILQALSALHGGNGFRGNSTVKTWLYRIAVNRCLEFKRKKRTDSMDSLMPLPDQGQGPEQISVERQLIREALDTLLPRHRLILVLREQEQASIPEIATMLGWTEKKVNNELFKARKALAHWRETVNL